MSATDPVQGGPVKSALNGHLHFLLKESTWTRAERAAVSLRGHLATVRNVAENQWIYDTFNSFGGNFRNLWIGLYDPDSFVNASDPPARRAEFVWVSGEPVTSSL